ncbi:MAG TPA: hypothetical protein VFB69_04345 [Candidatus Dormibacteraeota bacterium]|nr:hypothetical protein [Candidatus Dormibacteraeota bacterium]
MRRRHAALVFGALIVLGACGTSRVSEHLTATGTLVSDALSTAHAASSYHMIVTYQEGANDVNVSADLHFRLPGDVRGTVTENGNTVNVLQTDGKLYVQGKDFVSEYGGSHNGTLFGDRWVLVTPDLLRTTVLDLTKLTHLPDYFLNLDLNGKRVDHVVAGTEITAELDSTWGRMYISEVAPHRLAKVESATGYVAMAGYRGVDFELFEYDDPVDVVAPQAFADPNNPATLPPDFEMSGRWKFGACYYGEYCAFSGAVVNMGGTYPAPSSSYVWNLYTYPVRKLLGHCGGRIRTVAYKKTVGIGCQVNSAAYRAYTGSEVWGELVITNPSYAG